MIGTKQMLDRYKHIPLIGFFASLTTRKRKEHLAIIAFSIFVASIADCINGRVGQFFALVTLLTILSAGSYHLFELTKNNNSYVAKPTLVFVVNGLISFVFIILLSSCVLFIKTLSH